MTPFRICRCWMPPNGTAASRCYDDRLQSCGSGLQEPDKVPSLRLWPQTFQPRPISVLMPCRRLLAHSHQTAGIPLCHPVRIIVRKNVDTSNRVTTFVRKASGLFSADQRLGLYLQGFKPDS